MKNEPLPSRFRELSWRRKLSPAEAEELRAWLAAHPEAQTDWDAEAGLTEALDRLPKVPVASNFTARVLQAVEREDGLRSRSRQPGGHLAFRWTKWLPRAAFVAVVLIAGLLGVQALRAYQRTAEYRRSVTAVSEVASLPSPEILQDFEAIRALDQAPAPDEELLKALQ